MSSEVRLRAPNTALNEVQIGRYLRLLDVERQAPSLSALEEIVRAHLVRVPFENISKLYRWKSGLAGIPRVDDFLDGIERYNFGGTCYANNYHLYLLLNGLGYDVKLCSADMHTLDVHMVVMARVEGREYLVDGGYGAPFLSPIPRDLDHNYAIALGCEHYVVKPQDQNGCSRVELWRDGGLKHGYLAKPVPREIGYFNKVVADSFRPSATFLHAVLLVRLWPDRSTVIHNLTRIESRGMACKRFGIANREQLPGVIEEHYGIPAEITREALESVGEFRGAWD